MVKMAREGWRMVIWWGVNGGWGLGGDGERNVVEMEARRRVSPSSQLPSRAGELPSQRLVKI
jgi:hypothetical protein